MRSALVALDAAVIVMPYPTRTVIASNPRAACDEPVSSSHGCDR